MSSQAQSQYKLQVAICGGGIGGLALAFMLSNYAPDIKIDVYEATARYSEIGAGISLTWRSRRLVTELGLADDITAIGGQFDSKLISKMSTWRADQASLEVLPVNEDHNSRFTGIHRAQLHAVFLNKLGSTCTAHTSKRLASYAQPDDPRKPIRLVFVDGSVATCDVLIGADGVKSAVRYSMVKDLATIAESNGDPEAAEKWRSFEKPTFSGALIYRTMVPSQKLERISPDHPSLRGNTAFMGKNKNVISYKVQTPQGILINMAVCDLHYDLEGTHYPEPWVSESDVNELTHQFDNWDKQVLDLIASAEGMKVNRWVVNVVRGLPGFAHERVALLGDAAHAMTPFLGSGAGQALEDSYTLCTLLAHPLTTRETAAQALKAYSQTRRSRAQRFVESSRDNGLFFSLNKGTETMAELAALIDENRGITKEGDPLKDAQEAVEVLKALVA